MSSTNQISGKVIVLWVLWVALCTSIVVYQVSLGGGILHGSNASPQGVHFPMPLVLIQIAVASLIRWVIIPRVSEPHRLLVLLIVGLALSEAVGFYGIFLVSRDMPETKMAIFYLSLISALQFAPIYAGSIRISKPGEAEKI
jgi:hypothetical protein